jgi:hypothetical protein
MDNRPKIYGLFFQLEWLRLQELKLTQTGQFEKLEMNHFNQHRTAEKLRALETKLMKGWNP